MIHENIRLWMQHRTSTMCNERTFIANLQLAERIRHVEGAIVECGTWRGGMIAAIAEVLGSDREYVLADSFQGLPPAQRIDGEAAIRWQAENPHNCQADRQDAVNSMARAGVRSFQVLEGWFQDTLPGFREPIALLRLDADWYDSTMCCLHNLYDCVVSGGIVIVDDYYVWDGCARAVHEFLATSQDLNCASAGRIERICEHDGVAYMVKT